MAGGSSTDDENGITGINVVPLVDVMLVLLVIFMVATEFVQQEMKEKTPPNVPIQLPRAASGEDTPNGKMLMLVINSTGELFLNGKDATLPDVKRYVAEMKAEGAKLEAVVAADERLRHGQVVEVIDALRILGVSDVAINTKRQMIN